ncbi:MAG: hypothetical protein AVDCRST_MAG34-339, partial [uncultured Nocardioidaceae bacterium]
DSGRRQRGNGGHAQRSPRRPVQRRRPGDPLRLHRESPGPRRRRGPDRRRVHRRHHAEDVRRGRPARGADRPADRAARLLSVAPAGHRLRWLAPLLRHGARGGPRL